MRAWWLLAGALAAAFSAAACADVLGIQPFVTEGPDGSADARSDGAAMQLVDAGDGAPGAVAPCTPGGTCNAGPCAVGEYACTGVGAVCQAVAMLDAGTLCPGPSPDAGTYVCNGSDCQPCNAGADCSNPDAGDCDQKQIECTTGVPVCTKVGTLDLGQPCGTKMYCYGSCTACTAGAPCSPSGPGSNPCHAGTTVCSGGTAVCTEESTPAAAGTPCAPATGTSGVCDGNSHCVACSSGAACQPNGNPCMSGSQACANGYVCNPGSPINEGLPCGAAGAGTICHGGSCLACNATSCANGCCGGSGCVATGAQSVNACGTSTPGAACVSCNAPNSNGPSCSGGSMCSFTGCAPGYADCIANAPDSDGCETNVTSSVVSCGSCGHTCAGPTGATVVCVNAACIWELPLPAGANPRGIALGSDMRLWFTENGTNKIGAMKSGLSGSFTEYSCPGPGKGPDAITAGSGQLWFAVGGPGAIASISTSGSFGPTLTTPSGNAPLSLVVGPNGNIWYSDTLAGAIGTITSSSTFVTYPVPGGVSPYGITVGGDGRLWFAANMGSGKGFVEASTTSGSITPYMDPDPNGAPFGVAEGADKNVWFTDLSGFIGSVTPGGSFTTYVVPGSAPQPSAIAPGAGSTLWFSVAAGIAQVGTAGGVTVYAIPGTPQVHALVEGPDNAVYFADFGNNAIGRLSLN